MHKLVFHGLQIIMTDKIMPANTLKSQYADRVKEGTYLYPIPDTQMKVKEGLYEQNEAYK